MYSKSLRQEELGERGPERGLVSWKLKRTRKPRTWSYQIKYWLIT